MRGTGVKWDRADITEVVALDQRLEEPPGMTGQAKDIPGRETCTTETWEQACSV